jgi:hypothetical protein
MKKQTTYDIIKETVNITPFDQSFQMLDDPAWNFIISLMEKTGFVKAKENTVIVYKHIPSWFSIDHLEYVTLGEPNETGPGGMTQIDIAKMLFEFNVEERKRGRSNMNFTRPGEYRYTITTEE